MRVIAGSARRIQLKTPIGMETRPTTDRIKETLFNMLQPYLADAVFVDLFSGSGAIGIEALSRGAKTCYFIENEREALGCIKENLIQTKLLDHAEVMANDVFAALRTLEKKGIKVDVLFMDPPYRKELEKQVLEYLSNSSLLNKDAIIIFEASMDTETDYIESLNFNIRKIKNYKTNKHVFLEYIGTNASRMEYK
jgi:RNA methyltransferase, RsmD family